MPIDPRNPRNSIDRRLVEYDDKHRVIDLHKMDLVPPNVGIFDAPYRCYKLNDEWSKIVIGLVSWLAEITAWRDAEDDNYIAIQEILSFMIGGDCMEFMLRQNPNDNCLLEQSTDGGVNWTTAFDYSLCSPSVIQSDLLQSSIDALNDLLATYDGTVASVAPDMVYDQTATDDIRDLALCQALREMIEMMCQAELQYRQEVALAANLTSILLGIIGVIVTVASAGTGTAFYIGIAAALAGGAGTIIGGVSEQILDNRDTQETVACCMYQALRGATITQPVFEDSLDNCNYAPLSQEEQLRGAIAQLLSADDIYVTFLDYMQRTYKLAELGLASCGCDPIGNPQIVYDFTVSDQGFIAHHPLGDDRAVYTNGIGWEEVFVDTRYRDSFGRFLPSTVTITRVEVDLLHDNVGLTNLLTIRNWAGQFAQPQTVIDLANIPVSGVQTIVFENLTWNTDGIHLDSVGGTQGEVTPICDINITECRIWHD